MCKPQIRRQQLIAKTYLSLTPFASTSHCSNLSKGKEAAGQHTAPLTSAAISSCLSSLTYIQVFLWLKKSVKCFEYSTFSSHVNAQIKTQSYLHVIPLTHTYKVTNQVKLPTKCRKQVCSGSVSDCLRLWF